MIKILIILIFFFSFNISSMPIDNLDDIRGDWAMISDQVMGGVSEGSAKLDIIEKTKCHRMTGNVSTENNGGFIQIRTMLNPKININDYEGVFALVYGNNKKYS